ncbi:MAG: hypothetical protein ABDH31_05665 [Chlorobiota bacterium]
MTPTIRTLWEFQLRHALRSRWLLFYSAGLFLLTTLLFRFGGTAEQIVISLLNVILLLVPLISLLYGVLGMSQAREFLELMLAQPLHRHELFWGTFAGMVLPLMLAAPISIGIPWIVLVRERWELFATLAAGAMALTLMNTAFGVAFALWWEERLHAVGTAFALWFAQAVLYDSIALLLGLLLHEYPIERALLVLMVLNPIDLVRVATLLQLDAAALLGYTGALLRHFLGSLGGLLFCTVVLVGWLLLPTALAVRSFLRKDF